MTRAFRVVGNAWFPRLELPRGDSIAPKEFIMRSTPNSRSILAVLGFAATVLLPACSDDPPPSTHSASSYGTTFIAEQPRSSPGSGGPRSTGLSGRFEGSSGGQALVVELRESGLQVEGTIDGLVVRGIKRGSTATGEFITPDGMIDFGDWTVTAVSGGIDIAMSIVNLETGEPVEIPTVFCAVARSPAAPQQGSPAVAGSLDSRLIGAWRHTHVYGSGQFSGIVEDYLWLNEDGTYRESGNAAAGDANNSMITGPGNAASGRWKTEDKVLYVMAAGSYEWQKWSAYVCDGERLLFKFSKNSSKIWQRM